MNDTKNNNVDLEDLQDENVSEIDLDELYDEVELDDVDDFDEESVPVASPKKSSREKLWLILTPIFFILALLSSVFLPMIIANQTQRVDQVAEVIDKVNLTNISASRALTANGSYAGVKKNLANTQTVVNNLVGSPSGLSKISSAVFKNKQANNSVQQVWQRYKSATDAFLKEEEAVNEVKKLAVELDGAIGTTISESVGFVEAVAKEGRNKSGGSNKDKYLFLTSEAADLNGILSRLSASMRGYFNFDSNLSDLSLSLIHI